MKWISTCLLLMTVSHANAASIAVIDSGLDYKHEMIASNLWSNSLEVFDRRDNDGNGYQDDVHGWNFAEQNGQIIDYKYLGTFSPDCRKFFEIQGKIFLDQASEEDKAWLQEKRQDKKFIAELGKFGNFIHGTHVSGIAVENSQNQVMGIKLIPTEVRPFLNRLFLSRKSVNLDRWGLLQTVFEALANEQMKLLTDIARFTDFHQIDIANGSFGTGFLQAKMITDVAYRIIFFKKPSEEDSKKAARLFINALVKAGKNFVAAAPETLFVFAAGNDGLNNDEFGTSPANIKADNVITVGATYKNQFLAPFSNYGAKMVDVAAPGMLVNSAIPGAEYLEVSGTSQAAPYVANVAGKIKDMNPGLSALEIKQILMGTVDSKTFLKDKVSTGGIVNAQRALRAAELAKSIGVSGAITRANAQVRSRETLSNKKVYPKVVVPTPLTPMFR